MGLRWNVSVLLFSLFSTVLGVATLTSPTSAAAATTSTVDAGAYIIDVGQAQTIATGVKPYGLVYALLEAGVPVLWAISETKDFDGVDVTVGGRDYRGGPFVVDARWADLAAPIIADWRAQGVLVDGPLDQAFSLPIHQQLTYWPRSVVDPDNGRIAADYYVAAGIPATEHREASPSELTPCDDLYAMPHADPEWDTHAPLIDFNANGGFIWAACHAVSVLENVDDPADADAQPDMNFLSTSGLVPFGGHADGTPPYDYSNPTAPTMQILGLLDAATENGSEQIYLPQTGGAWNADTLPFVIDADHPDVPATSPGPAAVVIQGRGFGDPSNGLVLYEAGHNHQRGPEEAQVAGMRVFFNFHLVAGVERAPDAVLDVDSSMLEGGSQTVTASATGGSGTYDYAWSSTCGGTFEDATASTTTFTAPLGEPDCTLEVRVTDSCGRTEFAATQLTFQTVPEPEPGLRLTKTVAGTPDGEVATVEVGSSVTYDFLVENTGDTHLSDITITDDLGTPDTTDDVEVCRIEGVLPPGESRTCSIDLVVTVDTTNLGIATAVPSGPDGTPLNGLPPVETTDTAVVTVVPPPAPPAPPAPPPPAPTIPATGPAEEPVPWGAGGTAALTTGLLLLVGAHRTERTQRLRAIEARRLANRREWDWDVAWSPHRD